MSKAPVGMAGTRTCLGILGMVVLLLLQGCLSMSAPVKQRGEGTRRQLAGSEAEIREGLHALFAKMGSGFIVSDRSDLVQAEYRGLAGVAMRYKAYLSGAGANRVDVEMMCEMPGAGRKGTVQDCEKNFLDALEETVEFAQLKKGKAVAAESRLSTAGPSTAASDVDVPPGARTPPSGKRYAIVVGIEHYRQQLPTADFAVRDAETVAKYLTGALGFPEENIVTLTDDHAALGDFVKYFEKWLPNNVEPGATVFIYYSGHGAPNPKTGDAYLVPYDGDPAFIDETGYALKRMYAALGKLPAKEVVVALDSCFSGAGGRSVIAKGARSITMNLKETTLPSRNLTVLAASSGEQMSSTYAEKGHGLFTYFLLKGIKNEDVVAPSGELRIDDLFAYLQPQVERVARKQFNNEQTPQLIGNAGRTEY